MGLRSLVFRGGGFIFRKREDMFLRTVVFHFGKLFSLLHQESFPFWIIFLCKVNTKYSTRKIFPHLFYIHFFSNHVMFCHTVCYPKCFKPNIKPATRNSQWQALSDFYPPRFLPYGRWRPEHIFPKSSIRLPTIPLLTCHHDNCKILIMADSIALTTTMYRYRNQMQLICDCTAPLSSIFTILNTSVSLV